MEQKAWHIICEKDVGLFSLIQQVIGHVPLALAEKRIPVAFFRDKCCYWTENGYKEADNVWEYYFEPIIANQPSARLSNEIRAHIHVNHPHFESSGYYLSENVFVTNHFGDHPDFGNKSLKIPYHWNDPDRKLREKTSDIIKQYVRPRQYLVTKADEFAKAHMIPDFIIGVHIRASDVSGLKTEHNIHRRHSYTPKSYLREIKKLLEVNPGAKLFLATDTKEALDLIINAFPERVISYSSIFQPVKGASGKGAMGWGMPEYLTKDSEKAARNGEEALIDYLLLSQCQYLIHNGSGLARTVLLKEPSLPHTNIHSRKKYLFKILSFHNLEFYYLSRILIQKLVWRLAKLVKRKKS